MANMLTEPLRTEHQSFAPGIEAIDNAAVELEEWSEDDAEARIGGIVDFLRLHLMPHARIEEDVLYPAVDAALGAPGAMGTMSAEHAEIVERTERLAGTTEEITEWWSDPLFRREVARQLAGLGALIASHFHKEETVLFPILDARLSGDEAEAIMKTMHHAQH